MQHNKAAAEVLMHPESWVKGLHAEFTHAIHHLVIDFLCYSDTNQTKIAFKMMIFMGSLHALFYNE